MDTETSLAADIRSTLRTDTYLSYNTSGSHASPSPIICSSIGIVLYHTWLSSLPATDELQSARRNRSYMHVFTGRGSQRDGVVPVRTKDAQALGHDRFPEANF